MIVSKVPPRKVEGILWYNPLDGHAKAYLNGRWEDIYLTGDEISSQWIGGGTVSNDEFAQLDASNWDGETIKNWILAQIAAGGSAGVSYYDSLHWGKAWNVTHSLASRELLVQVWQDSTTFCLVDSIYLTSTNALRIVSTDSIDGAVVVGVQASMEYDTVFTSNDTVDVAHNFDTRHILAQIWEGEDTFCLADKMEITSDSVLQVTFTETIAGRIVVFGWN